MSASDFIEEATRRILPLGFKPEDYAMVDEELPLRLAILIVKEAKHMAFMAHHRPHSSK